MAGWAAAAAAAAAAVKATDRRLERRREEERCCHSPFHLGFCWESCCLNRTWNTPGVPWNPWSDQIGPPYDSVRLSEKLSSQLSQGRLRSFLPMWILVSIPCLSHSIPCAFFRAFAEFAARSAAKLWFAMCCWRGAPCIASAVACFPTNHTVERRVFFVGMWRAL